MVYTVNMLLEKYSSYSNPYNKIKRECLEGHLVKLKRGLYDDEMSLPAYLRSAYIYGPSYISFEYALSFYGLIPEYAPVVTCASFKKNKVKKYETGLGTFIYRDVPAAVFPLALIPDRKEGYAFIMAKPEKALCDELYTVRQVYSLRDFKVLLFDDLRIDKQQLRDLDWDLLGELAPKYRRSNTDHLLQYWEKENLK